MANEAIKNIRVGIFVMIGTALFIAAMYLIGDRSNVFGSTFRISANFKNVNGLMVGNNVRFGGINVGTIENIDIINDSTIKVDMKIENDVKKFIKKNIVASVGTDGLMGNKLINLNLANEMSTEIEEDDVIKSQRRIESDEMLKILNQTNQDVSVIVTNLKLITQKVNSPNTLWSILLDTVIAENVKTAIGNIKLATNRTAIITGDLTEMIKSVKSGEGSIGTLLKDTSFTHHLNQTLVNIKTISDTLGYIAGDLRNMTNQIKKGDGAIGTILMDTSFANDLNRSMANIRSGSRGFDENMEALKHTIFLRRYFKNIKKEQMQKTNLKIN